MAAVEKRLREELAKPDGRNQRRKESDRGPPPGESFGFLGFDFRRVHSLRGVWRGLHAKAQKADGAATQAQGCVPPPPIITSLIRVVKLINPVLRGSCELLCRWDTPSECFGFVQDWVVKKIRLPLCCEPGTGKQGFGWARWVGDGCIGLLKLFDGYRVVRPAPKAAPAG